jgi:hypothetical protein
MTNLFEYRIVNLISFMLLLALPGLAQHKINVPLQHQLDSAMVLDQKYREALSVISDGSKADSIAKLYNLPKDNLSSQLWAIQSKIDSSNIIFAEAVVKKYGYPGKTMVDSPANEAIWDIVQHSDKIDQYMPIIKKAADEKELPYYLYAMMLDRQLMYAGKEQVYGTQGTWRKLKSGKQETFIWPIKDPETVNERRKKAGFKQTVEDNASRLNIKYRVVTMDEIPAAVAKK